MKEKDKKEKSSLFDFDWKFKMPDLSGLFSVDWDKPSREQVDELMKQLPEPSGDDNKQDLRLHFGSVRDGKDQEDVHRRLLIILRMLLNRLKDLKARFKAAMKIKDPEKRRRALAELNADIDGLGDLVGHVGDNLPTDLISDDMHKMLRGCLGSIKEDLGELKADINKEVAELPSVEVQAPSGSLGFGFGSDKKKDKKDKDKKDKSSLFDFNWKFKMPDFSGLLNFDGDKPSREQVEALLKELPEPKSGETDQDLRLSFGKVRDGKDQDDIHRRLLIILRMLLGRLKELKARLKAIEKIKDPEKKRKALADFQVDLNGLGDLVGHVSDNLPRDLISDDMNKVLTGCLASIKDDLAELQDDVNKDVAKLPSLDVQAPSGKFGVGVGSSD